jgi:hypothetical protein
MLYLSCYYNIKIAHAIIISLLFSFIVYIKNAKINHFYDKYININVKFIKILVIPNWLYLFIKNYL